MSINRTNNERIKKATYICTSLKTINMKRVNETTILFHFTELTIKHRCKEETECLNHQEKKY